MKEMLTVGVNIGQRILKGVALGSVAGPAGAFGGVAGSKRLGAVSPRLFKQCAPVDCFFYNY